MKASKLPPYRFPPDLKPHIEQCIAAGMPDISKDIHLTWRRVKSLRRKEVGSSNTLKELPLIAKRIYGHWEFCKQNRISRYGFTHELRMLNDALLGCIKERMRKKYGQKRMWYGEILLNAYCDVLFYATNIETERENNIRPNFLKNPATGRNLEMDIYFHGLRLGLEFQGEQHYKNPQVINNDSIKGDLASAKGVCLIPVNPKQMNSSLLISLLANSLKDKLGVADNSGSLTLLPQASYKVLFKLIQRFDLAEQLFSESLSYLDQLVVSYIEKISRYSPVSTSTYAPRFTNTTVDQSVFELLHQIPDLARRVKKQS
jgi:hypothetical protein